VIVVKAEMSRPSALPELCSSLRVLEGGALGYGSARKEGGRAVTNRSLADVGPSTRLCAVIGNPVAHSLSPAIHNRAFQELGLDFVYLAFRVEDLRSAVSGMRALENFRGLSVTIPHKVAILEHLDEIAEVDAQIGSINTVVNEAGRLRGFGSDGPGARQALVDGGVEVTGQPLLILGSGGAARAIGFDLAHRAAPSSLVVLGVVEDELESLVRDLRERTGVDATGELLDDRSLERWIGESRVLIHATPVGMHPREGESLVPPEWLHADLAVMDIVYNPYRTRLLEDAEARGLEVIPGIEMFVNQALLQFEAWTGERAPRQVMRQVVLDHLMQAGSPARK
jgi:shikimate dehydrogenase